MTRKLVEIPSTYLKLIDISCISLEPVDQYLQSFSWNKVRYRADRSIADLIDVLHKVRCYTALQTLHAYTGFYRRLQGLIMMSAPSSISITKSSPT